MGGENSPTTAADQSTAAGGLFRRQTEQRASAMALEFDIGETEEEGFRLTVGLKVTVMFSSSLLVNFTDCCPGHCFGKEKYIYQTGHCTISSVIEDYDKITNTNTQMLLVKNVTP